MEENRVLKEFPSVDKKVTYKIKRFGFGYDISVTVGNVPAALSGIYTSMREAESAIIRHLSNTTPKHKSGSLKKALEEYAE